MLGGAAGVALAVALVDVLVALVPAEIPLATAVSVDGRVIAFAWALTVGAGLLVGLLPAVHTAGTSGGAAVPSRGSSATRAQRRAGNALLGLEIAQACALLVGAGLMANTLYRMSHADAGFDVDGLLFVHLDLPRYAYADGEARVAFLDDLTSRLRATPGVRAVGVGTATPFSGMTFMAGMRQEGGIRPDPGDGGLNVLDPEGRRFIYFSRVHVDPAYIETLGAEVVAGRALRRSDYSSGDRVALVNETAARAYWPGERPIGKRVAGSGEDEPWITVVGVVKDAHPSLEGSNLAMLYLPLTADVLPDVRRPMLLVRSDGAGDVVERVRRTAWEVDPELPIPAVATAAQELGASMSVPGFYALLLGAFAVLAMSLAAVGTYGVMAQAVARRTRDIGIRLALGATAHRVGTTVLLDGMVVVVAGLVIGLAVAAAASSVMEGLLFEVGRTDPWTYAAVATLLAGVALVAIWIPARRAMRADPVEALRVE